MTPTLLARYGGEEFVVATSCGTEIGAFGQQLEKAREAVVALAVPHEGARQRVLSVSIGFAWTVPPGTGSVETLIHAADLAMYAAKAGGGNRVHPGVHPGALSTDADEGAR